MAKKTKELTINLLPQEEFDASTLGRVLKWILTTFRYIVTVTEMIVMIAFLSRFWFDARSADLIDSINQRSAIVASYSAFESKFRTTQDKLKIYQSFSLDSQRLSPTIEDLSTRVPSDVTLTEISINNSKIEITAQSQNENSITNFINNLNASTFTADASLKSVESRSGPTTAYAITASLKGRNTNGN